MNIYRFIDSRDIREHLENLNYSFTAPEAAFLVYRCKTAALKEKFAAWNEIINTMPNCSMDKRSNMDAIPDFHQFLRDYMDLQTRMLRRFKEPNGNYTCKICENGPGEWSIGGYSTFDCCLSEALKAIRKFEANCTALHIYKHSKDALTDPDSTVPYPSDSCTLTPQGEVCELDFRTDNDSDFELSTAFEGMWFYFPTPFHGGDIVYSRSKPEEPFVLTDMSTWDSEKMRSEVPPTEYKEHALEYRDRRIERLRKRGDAPDMTAFGYGINVDETDVTDWVWKDSLNFFFYLDLEFYRKPLTGVYKALLPISNFIKNDQDLELLLNTFVFFLRQAQTEDLLKKFQKWYSADALERVGLSKKTKPKQEDK